MNPTPQQLLDNLIATWEAKQQTMPFTAFLRNSERALAAKVIEYAMRLNFWEASKGLVDESAWNTLVPDLALMGSIASKDQTVSHAAFFKISSEAFKSKSDFLMHMLRAFEEGDRFIVAKLAYDGGAE